VLASIAVVIWAPGCLVAGWWQATLALSGNTLSYLYTVEWPAFAVLGVFVWWHLVHLDPDTVGARGLARLRAAQEGEVAAAGGAAVLDGSAPDWPAAGTAAGPVAEPAPGPVAEPAPGANPSFGAPQTVRAGPYGCPDEDEELRAYNEYLASLRDRPKTWLRR
jgi:hypothetical protein